MKQTVSRNDFIDAFRAYGRMDNFTIEALEMLFEYFDNYEQECDVELELDVVGICCDFYEQDAATINDEYSLGLELDDLDDDEAAEAVAEALNDHTSVVGVTTGGSVVFQAF